MKKIIDRHVYDTATAKSIGSFSSAGGWSDFDHYREELFRTKAGLYFLHGEGGPQTRYAVSEGENSWSGGALISPLSEDAARDWAEKNLTADEYELAFGPISEEDTAAVTSYLPQSLLDKLDAKKADSGVSRSDIIIAALRSYLA